MLSETAKRVGRRDDAVQPERVADMFEVRVHGRGGQGVVTAAELLSVAAFVEGRYAQAFPSFGSERTGAPVVAFCRIADREIRTREPVVAPDALIVQDTTLLRQIDVFGGLRPDGFALINSARGLDELGIGDLITPFRRERLVTVPATDLALRYVGRSLPNTVLLGGFAALSGQISLASVVAAIRERFTGKVAETNVEAAIRAYELVRLEQEARDCA
jgi:pyruvate ferredoxin oxidoreductase gamma subunit